MQTVAVAMNNWVLAKAIALYYYNARAADWAEAFQAKLTERNPRRDPWHPEYAKEQVFNFQDGFPTHFGTLDFERQQLLIEVVLERYGEEAGKSWLYYTTGVFTP